MPGPQSQEGPYGSPLLDEIHRFFPALLYDSERFRTIPQVTNYVSRQMQQRFDIYSNARAEYRQRNRRTTAPPPQNQEQIDPATSNPVVSTPPPRRAPQSPPLIVRPVTGSDSLEQFLQSALLGTNTTTPSIQQQMINLLAAFDSGTMPLNTTFEFPISSIPINFNEPVIVYPSQIEIDEATTIFTEQSPEQGSQSESCAVCQDSYVEGAEVRRINHCRHRFHRRCIDRWFQQHVQCPVCRYDIRTPE